MIEKLKELASIRVIKTQTEENSSLAFRSGQEIRNKINELVDAVNEIMTWRFETDEEAADIGELTYLQKENSDLKYEVEKLQKQLAEWQNANISLIKDSTICNTYTHIRWDELCRLRKIADKYAEITGHKGVQNE